MTKQLQAFFSYATFDDRNDGGKLTALRTKLSEEVQAQTGEGFPIFQDVETIGVGQQIEQCITEAILQSIFLLPILTPSFFKSPYCRSQLQQFLDHEARLGRNDLILPIYYITWKELEQPDQSQDALVKAIVSRRYQDWRKLRGKPLHSQEVRSALIHIAAQIADAIQRIATVQEPAAPHFAPPAAAPYSAPPATATPQPAVPLSEEEAQHQRNLLTINMKHWLKVEEQAAAHAGEAPQEMRREELLNEINQRAGWLGLGSLPANLATIAQAVGLRDACIVSLQKQQQLAIRRKRIVEEQQAAANTTQIVDLKVTLQEIEHRLATIETLRQALLGSPLSSTTPVDAAVSPSQPTPEAGGGRHAPMLPTAEAQIMLRCAEAVARLSIPSMRDGQQHKLPQGSAWLIAPGLVMTCWHVVHARDRNDTHAATTTDMFAQVRNCILTFDYTTAGEGIDYGVAALEHAHRNGEHLDYAILRLTDRNDYPLARRTPLILDRDAPITNISPLYIIQHPGGQHQQQSEGTFIADSERAHRICYTNRTDNGTSGAPVFNRTNWRVLALHHGSTKTCGEGILIGAILDDLHQQHPALYQEIMQYQHQQRGTSV
jgi:hypothetical protein